MPEPTDFEDIAELPPLEPPVSDETDTVDVGGFVLLEDYEDSRDDALLEDSFAIAIGAENEPSIAEPETPIDIGAPLLTVPEEGASREDDVELEPQTDPESIRLDSLPELVPDVEEGAAEATVGLEELPPLSREDESEDEDELGGWSPAGIEAELERGVAFHVELRAGAPIAAVAHAGAFIASAGDDGITFVGGARTELPRGARALALTLDEGGGALIATHRGLISLPPGGAPVRVEAPELTRGEASVVELVRAAGRTLFARLEAGACFRSSDGGKTFERFETGGTCAALAAQGSHVALLVVTEQRPALLLSRDAGKSFRERLLPREVSELALGGARLATGGGAIALYSRDLGLLSSVSEGAEFVAGRGTVNVTAVTAGTLQGKPCWFAAQYREARDETWLLVVDPATGEAFRIAELAGGTGGADGAELGVTHALAWDGERLWAAGGYGLAELRPPRAS